MEDGRDSENRGKSVGEEETNTCLIILAILSWRLAPQIEGGPLCEELLQEEQ